MKKILPWLLLVAIAGVLALVLLPRVGSHPPGPRTRTMMSLHMWRIALDDYKRDCGSYPNASEGLNALLVNPGVSSWHGPYIEGMDIELNPKDGWKTPLKYSLTETGPNIVSAGPDRQFATADDLDAEMAKAWPSNNTSEGIRQPADGLPKPSM